MGHVIANEFVIHYLLSVGNTFSVERRICINADRGRIHEIKTLEKICVGSLLGLHKLSSVFWW